MKLHSLTLALAALVLCGCTTIKRQIGRMQAAPRTAVTVKTNPFAARRDPFAGKYGVLTPFKPQSKRVGAQTRAAAVAACISGGGHRSSNFATGVLLGLERYEQHNLLAEIDYFSTVSGGGFAAGNYLANLHQHIRKTGKPTGYTLRWNGFRQPLTRFNLDTLVAGDMGARLRANMHWAVAFAWLCHPKVYLAAYDRGDALEQKIDDAIFGAAVHPLYLGDMFVPNNAGTTLKLPTMAANSTVFESTEIFPYTPNMLHYVQAVTYTHRFDLYERAGADDFQFYFDVPLAVPVKASASFPVAFPTSNLRCSWDPGPFRRKTDARPRRRVEARFAQLQADVAQAADRLPATQVQKMRQTLNTIQTTLLPSQQESPPRATPDAAKDKAAPTPTAGTYFIHLQDGGVAENIGYWTAISMLEREPPHTPRTPAGIHRILLVIDAYPGTDNARWTDDKPASPNMFAAIDKQLNAGLEASHRLLQTSVANLCGQKHIRPVFFSFAELYEAERQEREYVLVDEVKQLKLKVDVPAGDQRYAACILRELQGRVQEVGTKLDLTKREQKLLLAAGLQVVRNQRHELKRLLPLLRGTPERPTRPAPGN